MFQVLLFFQNIHDEIFLNKIKNKKEIFLNFFEYINRSSIVWFLRKFIPSSNLNSSIQILNLYKLCMQHIFLIFLILITFNALLNINQYKYTISNKNNIQFYDFIKERITQFKSPLVLSSFQSFSIKH